jgi:phage shock protein E
MITKGAKVLDVRSLAEYNLGHYNNAIHIPANELNEETLQNKIDKNDIIVVYCNTGTRARNATEKLHKLGYTYAFYIVETYMSLN